MVQVACCWLRLAGKCNGPSGLLLVAFGGEMRWSKWLAAGWEKSTERGFNWVMVGGAATNTDRIAAIGSEFECNWLMLE